MPTLNYAGATSFAGGVNSGVRPELIDESAYYSGVNVVCRSGGVATRPDFTPLSPPLPPEFATGRFQGAAWYRAAGQNLLVFVLSGRVYLLDLEARELFSTWRSVGLFSQAVHRCYFCQAGPFMIVQDGVSPAVILSGTAARVRRTDVPEVPTGTAMHFLQGRLFVQVTASAIMAGDIYQLSDPETLLRFTEQQYLAEGGALEFPSHLGDIRALTTLPNLDSAKGDGPLLVFGTNGAGVFRVDSPRTTWLNIPFFKTLIQGVGCAGPNMAIPVGSDVVFFSPQAGPTSLQMIRGVLESGRPAAAYQKKVANALRQDTAWMQEYGSAVLCNNRFLTTLAGEFHPGEAWQEPVFRGILSLDMERDGFDGVWTGPRPTALVSGSLHGEAGTFVFGKTLEGLNRLFWLGEANTGRDGDYPIPCRVLTRSWYFKSPPDFYDQPFTTKKLREVAVWLRDVAGEVPLAVSVAGEGRAVFCRIGERTIQIPAGVDESVLPGDFEARAAQAVERLLIPQAAANDPGTMTAATVGSAMQLALEWQGKAEITRVGLTAEVEGQSRGETGNVQRHAVSLSHAGLLADRECEYVIPGDL